MKLSRDKNYKGDMVFDWGNDMKGKYVMTGQQVGFPPIEKMIGKLVQIRKESGEYGSDIVLIRHIDDTLGRHENQSFYLVPDEHTPYLDELFKETSNDDADSYEYTLGQKYPEKGFIISSKIKEGKSTPMREIRRGIRNQLKNWRY